MQQLKPIFVAHLFPILDTKLIELLESLSPDDWNKQTIAPQWKVKDVVVHLLDGNIRAISMLRDNYFGAETPVINSYQDLLDFLNTLNAEWVKAMKRVSPRVLIDLHKSTGKEFCALMQTLPPFEKALFSVAWAGEAESHNWFHVAREYTEKWHHQQQIRLAIGKEKELYTTELYHPHLETSLRALPHHYRNVEAPEGTWIQITITEEAGGNWFLGREKGTWILAEHPTDLPACTITIDSEIAWRLFTKGISKQNALPFVSIVGKEVWGNPIFDMLAVMA
jgi:uncharacterized protein (TIGR03083 family)